MTNESTSVVLLHNLISTRKWHAVIARITSNPHEVGSTLRDERGYTVLHKLLAYNRGVNGNDLVPVVRAILAAADAIDYASAYQLGGLVGSAGVDVNAFSSNVNEVALNEILCMDYTDSARGSWQLLADQNNRASWSPLHLMCVQGGFTHGKVSLLKALLQINNDDDRHHQGTFTTTLTATAAVSQRQYQILTLLDRQKRNILHHMLDIVIPSEDTADTIRLAVSMVPSLLYQRDIRDCTPLEYVLSRLVDNTNSNNSSQNPRWRKRHLPNNYGNDTRGIGKLRNYTILKLLVESMHTDNTVNTITDNTNERGGRGVQQQQLRSSRRNVLQMSCLLPRAVRKRVQGGQWFTLRNRFK